jgi:hypothetical protein
MTISQISLNQMLALMDESVRDRVVALAHNPGITHLVFFENQALDSSHLGESSVVAIGPENTFKSLADIEGKWLHDLPSQRQYPQFWCDVDGASADAANWCPNCKRPIRRGFCTPGYRGVHIQQWIYRDDVPAPSVNGNHRLIKTKRRNSPCGLD